MLTIRIIKPDGTEFVKEVKSVMFMPCKTTPFLQHRLSYFQCEECSDITDGKVYVMNENGKTIANYILSIPPTIEAEPKL